MSKIFINYRRKDSAPYAGRLYDRLAGRFGDDLCLWISPMRTGSGVWIIRMIGFGLKSPVLLERNIRVIPVLVGGAADKVRSA